jgi:hypothetical protein
MNVYFPAGNRARSSSSRKSSSDGSAPSKSFSLHADVAVPARRRDQLERLCRYLLRPPLAVERLTRSTGGQLVYQFKRPWRDGSTALLVDPLELLERFAALVPPPRRPLLAYHGLLAPRARWSVPSDSYVLPNVRRTWAPRGQTPCLRHRYRHDRLSVCSGLAVSPRR